MASEKQLLFDEDFINIKKLTNNYLDPNLMMTIILKK